MRHPEQALTTIQANVNQHPDDPDLLGVYGLALLATGKTQEGMEQLKRALSIDPQRVIETRTGNRLQQRERPGSGAPADEGCLYCGPYGYDHSGKARHPICGYEQDGGA